MNKTRLRALMANIKPRGRPFPGGKLARRIFRWKHR